MPEKTPQLSPAETLVRLGRSNFYFILSPKGDQILEQFYKPQLEKTIEAIQQTLSFKPDPSLIEQDVIDIEASIIQSNLNFDRKEAIVLTMNRMVMALSSDSEIIDSVRLRQRLSRLQSLYAQMEK